MNRHPSARELHEAHEDNRSAEAARVRQAVRVRDAEALGADRVEGLWGRRVWALQNTSGLASLDFDGCVD